MEIYVARDGNKSPDTRFNKVYENISKTEQASEITTQH